MLEGAVCWLLSRFKCSLQFDRKRVNLSACTARELVAAGFLGRVFLRNLSAAMRVRGMRSIASQMEP